MMVREPQAEYLVSKKRTAKGEGHLPSAFRFISSSPHHLISSFGYLFPHLRVSHAVAPVFKGARPRFTASPCLAEGSPRLCPRLRLEASSGEAGSSRRARHPISPIFVSPCPSGLGHFWPISDQDSKPDPALQSLSSCRPEIPKIYTLKFRCT